VPAGRGLGSSRERLLLHYPFIHSFIHHCIIIFSSSSSPSKWLTTMFFLLAHPSWKIDEPKVSRPVTFLSLSFFSCHLLLVLYDNSSMVYYIVWFVQYFTFFRPLKWFFVVFVLAKKPYFFLLIGTRWMNPPTACSIYLWLQFIACFHNSIQLILMNSHFFEFFL
jgi:hypothetical protein